MTALAKLKILTGRHAGAEQTLTPGEAAIGSSLGGDIVLTDPSIAPLHAKLSCGRFRLELEAVDASVSIDGRKLEPGDRITSAYPVRFALGDVETECVSFHETFAFPALASRNVTAAAFGLLLIFAAARVLWPLHGTTRGVWKSPAAVELENNQSRVETTRSQGEAAQKKTEIAEAAAIALQEHLAAAGLQSIDASAEDGSVRAKGAITQASENAWRTVQLWFDGSFGQEVMLRSEVAISAPKSQNAPIGIQAVWAGKRPYLIDEHGDKYFEGSFLKDGWVVEKIEDGRVLLRRNQEVLSLSL